MITAEKIAKQAKDGNYIGIKYEELDCQALIERILKDCGEKHDWRGSNHMWRDAVTDRELITEIENIPVGALVFTVKNDGGEKERGYNDNMGNAKHVGLYLGNGDVIHSTRNNKYNGVQMDVISSSRWTHYALLKCVLYNKEIPSIIDCLRLLGDSSLLDIYTAAKQLWG